MGRPIHGKLFKFYYFLNWTGIRSILTGQRCINVKKQFDMHCKDEIFIFICLSFWKL